MRRIAVLILILWAGASLADTAFQATDEWTRPMSFTYPSGRYRLPRDNDIRAYSVQWSDTSGKTIPADSSWARPVGSAGDSIGFFVWKNLPPSEYKYVECIGTDSVFVNTSDRWGFKTAPTASVADSAIVSMDGAKLLPASVDSAAIDTAAVDRIAIAADAIDSSKVQNGQIPFDKLATSNAWAAGGYLTKIGGKFGWAVPASGGVSDSSDVPDGSLSVHDLKVGGSQSATVYLRSTGTNGGLTWDTPAGSGDITGVGVLPGGMLSVNADSLSGKPLLSLNSTQANSAFVNEGQAGAIADSGMIAAGVVTSSKIKDGQVKPADLAGFTIADSAKFGAGVITSSAIQDGQVKSADIQDLGIQTGDLAAGAVGDSAKIAANVVTSAKIVDGQVKPADLAGFTAADSLKFGTGSITSTAIATGQVKSADIQDLGVENGDLAATAVDSSKIPAASLARSDLAIGGTATAGYVPKSTGLGWAWAADTGLTSVADSSQVADGALSVHDLKVGGTEGATKYLRGTGTNGGLTWDTPAGGIADSTGYPAASIPLSAIKATGAGDGKVLKATGSAGMVWGTDNTGSVTLPMDSVSVTGPTLLNGTVRVGDAAADSLQFPGTVQSTSGLPMKSTKGYIHTIKAPSNVSALAGATTFELPPTNAAVRSALMGTGVGNGTAWSNAPTFGSLTSQGAFYAEGAVSAGNARADSLIMMGTFAARDAGHLAFMNEGGTGVTTLLAPRVTASVTANMVMGGQLFTTSRTGGGGKSVYVAGMSTAGRCVASKVRTATDTRTNVISCSWVTDSVIVYSSVAVDTVNYLYWR